MLFRPKLVACLVFTFVRTLTAGDDPALPADGKADGPKNGAENGRVLFNFEAGAGEPGWEVVNDDVMGGVSRGGGRIFDGTLFFSGVLSLENNGGFASIRARGMTQDLRACSFLILRVRGDSRTYRFMLGTDARYRSSRVAYQCEFSTRRGEWIEVRVPLNRFAPTFRGQSLSGPPLDLGKIEEFGLMLADGKPGPFALEVEWIRAE